MSLRVTHSINNSDIFMQEREERSMYERERKRGMQVVLSSRDRWGEERDRQEGEKKEQSRRDTQGGEKDGREEKKLSKTQPTNARRGFNSSELFHFSPRSRKPFAKPS